jgi:rhomboid family GlyGly-CTERM serine protease
MSDAFRGAVRAITPVQATWLVGLVVAALVLLSLGGESWREALRYERVAVLRGEYWRLLSGHLVHGTTQHLLLNVLGLGVIAALFPREFSLRGWLFVAAASVAVIDLGFVLWEPQLEWYVGLSGVLHGVLAAGAIAWWRHESKGFAAVLTVVLVAKLAWEQGRGALPLSGDMPVIVDAHLYGAIGGALAASALWALRRGWSPRPRSL